MKRRRKQKRPETPFPLKEVLKRLGWSQRKLAMASDINMSQINQIANFHTEPKWSTILWIARTIGADLGDFRPGKDGAA